MESATATETPAVLAENIEAYLTEHPIAAVLEDGQILFEMRSSRYSIGESHGRCVFQLWSEDRNMVRTVLSLQHRTGCLRLMTRKMGALKPSALELVPTSDRRTPTAREAGRRQYLRLLERVLQRTLPDWKVDGLRTAADLENSFGPAYARGRLLKGTTAEAVIGVGADESSSTIDGILTLGLLWFDRCREQAVIESGKRRGSRHYSGLKVVVPAGAWRPTSERMTWLNHTAAHFQLFTLDELAEELIEVSLGDGNLESHLVHAFDVPMALKRARLGIDRVMALIHEPFRRHVELRAGSAVEVGLLLHGLEFARVRSGKIHSFARELDITFGAGANETALTDETEALCCQLLDKLFASRIADGKRMDPLFRLQPERWLESKLRMELEQIAPGIVKGNTGEFLYTQVPAITSGERGMLDLLTVDRDGRLLIIEVKADEDMQLPLQGLDYWIRVRALNADRKLAGNHNAGAFERHGYFPGKPISDRPPKLLLIAPALRIHPSNEIVLRYLSREVEWELVAVGEHWRRELKVVFRKRGDR